MKKLIYGGLFLAAVGITIFACSKKELVTSGDCNSQKTENNVTKSASEDTVNLVFEQANAENISKILNVIQFALLDLTKNAETVAVIRELVQDNDANEKVYLNKLERRLSSQNIDLLKEMENSLMRHGGSSSDLNLLKKNYNEIEIDGSKYETFIFVPFADEVNYNLSSVVSFSVNNSEYMEGITGFQLDTSNEKEKVDVKGSLARTKQIWVISLSDINDSDLYPALPWQKCYCDRGGKEIEDGGVNTRGTCVKNGECGFCDRANIWGSCPKSGCPGC